VRLTKNFFRFYFVTLLALALILLFQNNAYAIIGGVIVMSALGLMVYWYEKGGKKILENNNNLVRLESKNDEAIKQKLVNQGSEQNKNLASRLMHGIINLNVVLPIYEKYLARLIDNKKTRYYFLAE